MSEYYAVQRTGNDLAHYGVKGMRWGIRKAIAKSTSAGKQKALAKQYKKASKKLDKLMTKANIEAQKANVSVQKKKAIRSGLATLPIGGIAALTRPRIDPNGQRITQAITNLNNGTTTIVKRHNAPMEVGNRTGHYISGGLTAAGLAKTAYHTGKAIASKYRTTSKGHAKAVAKAKAWKSEMDKAFAGTPYAKSSSKSNDTNRHGKRRRSSRNG